MIPALESRVRRGAITAVVLGIFVLLLGIPVVHAFHGR